MHGDRSDPAQLAQVLIGWSFDVVVDTTLYKARMHKPSQGCWKGLSATTSHSLASSPPALVTNPPQRGDISLTNDP
jgi:hypothetical protein